ncbi:hypothetical protein Ocin01_04989 [Orchesella cincta]|uniref:Uncharacterized protein n=1 Tax=Orchesella cincta TaxID=48709 RepID=A0A1D2N8W6_ORCCI|nr:hypothetical protein Ocin01_04989 [Orchesella cincta]
MSNPGKVKQEKTSNQEEDKELAEWARKLVSKPNNQIGIPQNSASGGIAPIFGQHIPNLEHSGIDRSSAVGRFTWETFGDEKSVPCVFRNEVEYVAIRMAEISVIGDLLNVLPCELYDTAKLTSYYLTPAEAKLLTYVNSWHCDGFFGPEPFSTLDMAVSLKDLRTFYDYLYFAYSVLHSGGKNLDTQFKHCGFVRVNSDSMIPYTVISSEEKGVPLFYFEGQTDILKEKAKPLTGWPLAYLKVCCKVQGVRKDLISGSTLLIVTLTDLQGYFPRRTSFTEKCWPPPKPKSLLPKQSINVALSSPLVQVTCDKWTKVEANETFANYTTTGKTNTTNTATVTTVVMDKSKNGVPSNVTLNTNGVSMQYQIPKSLQTGSPALAKVKISKAPVDKSRLMPIPEHPDGLRDGAYVVRLIVVEKELMHCINMRPGKSDDYLVLLQEFMTKFFPSISIYPTAVSVLRNMEIVTYLPNCAQIRALNGFGFQIQEGWEMPLIPAQEASHAMARLRQVFKPRPNSVTTNVVPVPVVSSRVSNGGNCYPTYATRR